MPRGEERVESSDSSSKTRKDTRVARLRPGLRWRRRCRLRSFGSEEAGSCVRGAVPPEVVLSRRRSCRHDGTGEGIRAKFSRIRRLLA